MEAASFPDEAHSPTDDMTISELQSEIQFQVVLLQSIDDSVPNRDDAEKEVVAEIKRLKLHLQKRKGELPTSSPQANVTTNGIPANMNSAMGIDPFARSSHYYGDPFSTNSSTASTPNSGASQYADLDSNHIDLPTRKRTHSKVAPGVLSPGFHKSQRTSPSPYDNGQITPSTGEDDIDPGFIEQQKQAEERIKREKMDADYAMSVSQAFTPQDIASFSATRTHGGFSAFDRMSGARPQPSSSLGVSSARKPIPSFGESSRLMNGVKHEDDNSLQMGFSSYAPPKGSATFGSTPNSRTSYANGTGIKSESSASRQMPGSYRDDSSTSGDSDIEFISSTAFHDNGRFSSTPGSSSSVYGATQANQYGHGYFPESQNASGSGLQRMNGPASNSALHMAMYGKGSVAPWMKKERPSSQQPGSIMSTPPYNPYATQQGVGPSGYPPGVYDGMIQHPGMASGSMNDMHQSASYGSSFGPGLGYQINDLSSPGIGNEYDMDFTQTGVGQPDSLSSIIRRANNGNFDELGEYLKLDSSRYSQLDYIMSDPRKTEQEIKDLLENIRPDSDLPPEDRAGTPEGLKYPLYEHQKLALTWMKSMEEGTNKGGILADDMGLGKTISTLALLLTRPSEDRLRKTTLIVGPVALIRQWVRELQQKINVAHKLSVQMVHGSSGKKMGWDDLRNFDVVLTTYGTLGAEYRRWEKYVHQLKLDNVREADGNACKKTYPFFGPKSAWYRVILDEAQCIKNKNTQNAKAACNLKSLTRFCLTGTPMMNGVGELYSLIHFLRIKPYNDYSCFTRDFGKLSKGKSNHHETENAMRKLQTVLKAILLRRTKTSLIDGKPIITLPPKTEEIQHVVFSEDEQGFYKALEQKSQLQFNKYMKAGTVMKNYANVLVLLLRLRQCCCHPHLIQDFEKAQPAVGSLDADVMIELAKSLAPDVVGRLLAAEAFECPVCYDAVDNPSIVIPCGHDTCSECLSKISDTADQNNIANGEEGVVTKCPTCRGKVDINKIIDYTTFKKVYKPDPVGDDEEADESNGLSDDESSGSESDSDTESESDMDEAGNLKGFIVRDDEEESDEGETEDDGDDDLSESKEKPKAKKNAKKDKRRRWKGKGKAKEPFKHKSLAMLKAEASKSIAGRKKYMKALKKNWESSAKVDKCVDLLRRFQADGQKTIIFSQFVSLLDLLSIPIEQEGWNCGRYDGSMNANARHQACVDFTDKPDVKIMLISLKAGNAGLNLVAASRVIILDPFWNPYIEMQAVDRAHRIGQQREVEVHRILIKNTVEDRIIELQERKKALINAALDEGSQESIGRLDARQLAFLFGVGRM